MVRHQSLELLAGILAAAIGVVQQRIGTAASRVNRRLSVTCLLLH